MIVLRPSSRDEAGDGGKTMTSEELRRMTIEHAADNLHGKRWDAGNQFGSGFFGGGLMAAARGGAEAALQARSRLVKTHSPPQPRSPKINKPLLSSHASLL